MKELPNILNHLTMDLVVVSSPSLVVFKQLVGKHVSGCRGGTKPGGEKLKLRANPIPSKGLWPPRAPSLVLRPSFHEMLEDALPLSRPQSLRSSGQQEWGRTCLAEPPRWERLQKERPIFIHYHIQELGWGATNRHF